ncbi:uncharacterized protein METZ01_LOCUS54006 [marine metagenome]|uniref:Uncharacterized protein n=1 Tax=marine metagenome TaxID=408172 RepID=A0A381SAN4_9ZZZZ
MDGNTGEFIPHANILVKNTYRGTISDQYGFFTLSGTIQKVDTLIISYIGYDPTEFVVANRLGVIRIELFPKVLGAKTVNIYGEQLEFLQRSSGTGQLAFSPRHIASLPNIGETDIFRSLQLLPGIQMGNTGFAGLYIRGGTPDQNQIILDGMSIYQVDHFFGFFSAINSNIVKDVQVYKGGFPAKYGGRIASIIDITGKSGSTKQKKLDLFTNMLSAGVTYEQPLSKRSSFILSARRSFTDQYQTKLYDNIHDFLTSGSGLNIGAELQPDTVTYQSEYLPNFYFYDINGKFTYLPNDRDIVSISFYDGKDYLGEEKNFDFESDSVGIEQVKVNEQTRWGNTGAGANWVRRWSRTTKTQLFMATTRYFSNHDLDSYWIIDTEETPAYLSQDNNQIEDQTARMNVNWNIGQRHDLEVGVSTTRYKTNYSVLLGDSVLLIDQKINGNLFEGYFQDRWTLSPGLVLLLGLRTSRFSKSSVNYFNPRLSIYYRFTEELFFKASTGTMHQFLNRFSNDLITNGSKFVWLLPNDATDPMDVQQISLGIEYDTPHIFIGLDIYNKVMDNITDFSQLVFPVDTYKKETNSLVFKGNMTAKGLELLVRKKDGYLRGWAAYNYGIVECKFPDLNGGKTFLADHDRTHELKSAIIWSLGPWNMAVTGLISSGRVYTPNNNLMIRENENANYTLVADVGTRNSKRLPIVHRIDMSLTRSLRLLAKNWDIGISIFNLFNQRNISHRSYNLTADPFITTDIVMLGLTPTLSVRLEI